MYAGMRFNGRSPMASQWPGASQQLLQQGHRVLAPGYVESRSGQDHPRGGLQSRFTPHFKLPFNPSSASRACLRMALTSVLSTEYIEHCEPLERARKRRIHHVPWDGHHREPAYSLLRELYNITDIAEAEDREDLVDFSAAAGGKALFEVDGRGS